MPKEYAVVYPRSDSTFEVELGRPFHAILKEARECKGIGLRELARKLKCSHVYLLKIEQGERTPSPLRLNELQKELDIAPFFLVPVEEFERFHGEEIRGDGKLKEGEQSASFLIGHLIAALRQGGFDPTLGVPTEMEKERGIRARLCLGSTRNYEILIREIC